MADDQPQLLADRRCGGLSADSAPPPPRPRLKDAARSVPMSARVRASARPAPALQDLHRAPNGRSAGIPEASPAAETDTSSASNTPSPVAKHGVPYPTAPDCRPSADPSGSPAPGAAPKPKPKPNPKARARRAAPPAAKGYAARFLERRELLKRKGPAAPHTPGPGPRGAAKPPKAANARKASPAKSPKGRRGARSPKGAKPVLLSRPEIHRHKDSVHRRCGPTAPEGSSRMAGHQKRRGVYPPPPSGPPPPQTKAISWGKPTFTVGKLLSGHFCLTLLGPRPSPPPLLSSIYIYIPAPAPVVSPVPPSRGAGQARALDADPPPPPPSQSGTEVPAVGAEGAQERNFFCYGRG